MLMEIVVSVRICLQVNQGAKSSAQPVGHMVKAFFSLCLNTAATEFCTCVGLRSVDWNRSVHEASCGIPVAAAASSPAGQVPQDCA